MKFCFILLIFTVSFSTTVVAIVKKNIFTSLNPDCPADCQDIATNCLENIASCFDPNQYDAMFQACRCTCSFCPEPETKCQDVDPTCPSKAYECSNIRYKPLMCKYCRKSCQFCNDPCSLLP